MFFGEEVHNSESVQLQLSQHDCDMLATACNLAALYARNPEKREDPKMVAEFEILCALFMGLHWGLQRQASENGNDNADGVSDG